MDILPASQKTDQIKVVTGVPEVHGEQSKRIAIGRADSPNTPAARICPARRTSTSKLLSGLAVKGRV